MIFGEIGVQNFWKKFYSPIKKELKFCIFLITLQGRYTNKSIFMVAVETTPTPNMKKWLVFNDIVPLSYHCLNNFSCELIEMTPFLATLGLPTDSVKWTIVPPFYTELLVYICVNGRQTQWKMIKRGPVYKFQCTICEFLQSTYFLLNFWEVVSAFYTKISAV